MRYSCRVFASLELKASISETPSDLILDKAGILALLTGASAGPIDSKQQPALDQQIPPPHQQHSATQIEPN